MSNNTTVDLQRLRYGPLGRRSTSDVIIGACHHRRQFDYVSSSYLTRDAYVP
jgi:hypothetical protein